MKTSEWEKNYWENGFRNYQKAEKLLGPIELKDRIFSSSEVGACVAVFSREELQTMLKLAPKWDKSKSSRSICYTARIDDMVITIEAYDAALPATCHVVEETVHYDAQPARTETHSRIVCDVLE